MIFSPGGVAVIELGGVFLAQFAPPRLQSSPLRKSISPASGLRPHMAGGGASGVDPVLVAILGVGIGAMLLLGGIVLMLYDERMSTNVLGTTITTSSRPFVIPGAIMLSTAALLIFGGVAAGAFLANATEEVPEVTCRECFGVNPQGVPFCNGCGKPLTSAA